MTTPDLESTNTPANRWDRNRTERQRLGNEAKLKEFHELDQEFGVIVDLIEQELLPLNADGSPNLEKANLKKAQEFLDHIKEALKSVNAAGTADAPKQDVTSSTDAGTADAPKGFKPAWKLSTKKTATRRV